MKPVFDTTKMMPFSQSGVEARGAVGRQWRKVIVGGIMSPLDSDWLDSISGDLGHLIKTLPDAEKSVISFEFHNATVTLNIGQNGTASQIEERMGRCSYR